MSCRLVIFIDRLRGGGTEQQALYLAKGLRSRGHDVRLLVNQPGGALVSVAEEAQVPVMTLQKRNLGLALLAPGLFAGLRRGQPDVLLCMGRTANCYAGFIKQRYPSLRVVSSIRTSKRLLPWHNWSLSLADRVWVNCRWWERRLLADGHDPAQVWMIHNGCRLEWHGALPDRPAHQPLTLINVASFRTGKCQAELIAWLADWLRRRPAVRLLLVGEGPERARCQRLAQAMGLASQVVFSGYQQDVRVWYAQADIAVSLSREDALPNFLVEAQMMGLPVVARSCLGVSECVNPGRSGWVFPAREPMTGLATLTRLAEDALLRETAGRAARTWAAQCFHPQLQLDQVEVALKTLGEC